MDFLEPERLKNILFPLAILTYRYLSGYELLNLKDCLIHGGKALCVLCVEVYGVQLYACAVLFT